MKGDDSLALWGRVGPVDLLTGPPVRVDLMVEEARFVGPLAPSVYKTWGDSMNLADVDSVVGSVGPGAQLASAGLLPSWQPPSDDPSFASSPRRPSEPIMVTFRVTIPFTPARLVSTPTGQGDLGSFRERIQRSTPAMLPLPKRRRSARHGSPVVEGSGASVVCLQETKLQHVDCTVVSQCLGINFDGFLYLSAVGTRGGILLAWKSSVVSISNPHLTANAVTARVVAPEGQWWIIGVYGLHRDADKLDFLQELWDIRDLHPGPWVVAGDFNLIVNPEDKSNGRLHRSMMARFRRVLTDLT
ncbi:hypothetical protein BRADI_3g32384v3 [Brachypodium distachyon]|uniref:Endonuclease/exonuclease/phosphatase domain-containing protein n=1 Tax=Brachypodium distachyon TaxID=15368 RepID=A0A2K2D0L8_BRADI|nr:hypothetical protein BRADI_3g32384v3 [Brachypodium distachyon]